MKLRFVAVPFMLVGLASAWLPAADDSVLFSDDFAALRPGWGAANDIKSVSGNKLLLNLAPNLIQHTLYEAAQFENVDLRAKVAQIKGGADQPGGIIFWAADNDNFYMARVRADGGFSVGRRMRGQWLSPVFLQVRDEALKGLGQVNALRVVTSGKSATVYVNDKQIVAMQGFPPKGPSKIGVYAESGKDPATWAFSELSVRKGPLTPEATGPRDDALLLSDDFGTLDPAWGKADAVESVSGGKLLLTLRPNVVTDVLCQASLFENADIRMTVVQTAGGKDQPGGVLFWATDHKNYYAALLRSDGTFLVGRKANGKWLNPVGAKVRDEVLKGLGQANQLRVVTSGKSATVYLNDKQVVTLKGFPPQGGGMVGVQGESDTQPYTWAFSALSVRKGPAPPDAKSPRDDSLLLADDFATLDPAWGDADGVQAARGNKLLITPQPNTSYTSLYQGNLFGDADIRVKVAATKGQGLMPAGMVFWASDYAHFYTALLRSDGSFFVGSSMNNQWQHLVPLKVWPEVLQGLGQVNELRVVLRGKAGTAYVNNKPIGTFAGSPPEDGSKLGLRAQSGADAYSWEFSDLLVRKPP